MHAAGARRAFGPVRDSTELQQSIFKRTDKYPRLASATKGSRSAAELPTDPPRRAAMEAELRVMVLQGDCPNCAVGRQQVGSFTKALSTRRSRDQCNPASQAGLVQNARKRK